MPDPARPSRPPAVGSWWTALAIGLAAGLAAKRPLSDARQPRAGAPRGRPGSPATHQAAPSAPATARSLKALLSRLATRFGDDRVPAVAASVTFYCLLALFPAIAALVSLYGLFADPHSIERQLASMSGVMPGGAIDIIGGQVKRIAAKPHGSLGFGVAIGLAVALWSANAGVKAIFDALNVVHGEKEKRNFFVLNGVTMLCTLGALVVVMLALGAVVAIPVVLNLVGLGPLVGTLLNVARWPLLLVVIMGTFRLLYRIGPSRAAAPWRWFTWGSSFAAVAWIVGSMLFSFYVGRFGSYDATYGSLGAAIGFMTWLWISATIVLLGAEIDVAMQRPA